MKRILVLSVLIGWWGGGCASHRPAPVPPPSPRHVTLPPRAPVQRERTPPAPGRPAPRIAPPASTSDWLPASGRVSPRWTTVVLHHSGTARGSAATFDKFHRQKGWDELGYHFVIGNGTETPDGYIEVGSRWQTQKHGAHCKTPGNYFNDHGIGICLVGDFTKRGPTRRQIDSLNRLVRFLCHHCRIPPERVTTHHEVNHRTACPGKLFPVATVRRFVAAGASAAATR